MGGRIDHLLLKGRAIIVFGGNSGERAHGRIAKLFERSLIIVEGTIQVERLQKPKLPRGHVTDSTKAREHY
jgi:hypothetical protein